MEAASLCLFALALSMDALSIGVAYGMRRIRVPGPSLLIIGLLSGVTIYTSMKAGAFLANSLSHTAARCTGGLILTGVGMWTLIGRRDERVDDRVEAHPPSGRSGHIIGLLGRILREPQTADLDQSGTINPYEALLLGFALAMDSMGAGLAVSMLAFNPVATAAAVGIGQTALACTGLLIGRAFSSAAVKQKVGLVPGLILIVLGLARMRG